MKLKRIFFNGITASAAKVVIKSKTNMSVCCSDTVSFLFKQRPERDYRDSKSKIKI